MDRTISLQDLKIIEHEVYKELTVLDSLAMDYKNEGNLKRYKDVMGSVKFQRGKCCMIMELIEKLELGDDNE